MKTKLPVLILSMATVSTVVHAQWQLVSDFQTEVPADIITHNTHPDTNYHGQNFIENDPADTSSGNKVYSHSPEHFGIVPNSIYSMIPLPGDGVAEGSTATLYYRYRQAGHDHDINTGLSPLAIGFDGDGIRVPRTFGHFEVQTRWNDNITARDGGAFVLTTTPIPANTWIEVWAIVDNTEDLVTLYIKAEGDSAATLVPIPDGAGGFLDNHFFRNGTTESLKTFFMGSYNGDPGAPFAGDPFYVDDIYVDYSGTNMSSPEAGSATWAGYAVVDGWADTGDWLGWIYVSNSPWLYSDSLDGWIYMDESTIDAAGGWSFVIAP